MKKDIKSLTYDELNNEMISLGLPRFRADQIFGWLHKRGVTSFEEMSNLSKSLRAELNNLYFISSCKTEEKYVSEIDGTVKYLYRLSDGEYIESVVMKYKYGHTVCVSTQVGCRMGCSFCASALAGFKRNLSPGEIEGQIHAALQDLGIRISNVVLMGIGEPLDNFENVLKFIENVNNENGLNISMRSITLSTCGIVPRIYDLMEKKLPVTLTISLHAPNDEIRKRMMPINAKWNVKEIIKACREYVSQTGRRISFEYTLIKDVNDSPACAAELAQKLKGLLCHVNLIPVNGVKERENIVSTDENIYKFSEMLKKAGINATIRRTLGSDINASCGQLRRKRIEVK